MDFFWCGGEFINVYKFYDAAGQFSLLGFDATLSSGYAGDQILCQYVGHDCPPDHELAITAQADAVEAEGAAPQDLDPWLSQTSVSGLGRLGSPQF